MAYSGPHFLGCNCQCESKRQLLRALLDTLNKFSISRRSFLLIYPAVADSQGGPKPSHDIQIIQYDEYQCVGVPTHTLVMRGNIGDLCIDKTPASYALYAKTSATEWEKWPGPLSTTNTLRHPLYPHYVLWCHPPTRTISWFFDILVNKIDLPGSSHDIISGMLEKRGEAEVSLQSRYKRAAKRKNCPSEDQEGTPTKRLKGMTKVLYNDPQEAISRLEKEAVRLKNAHTALQELVATPLTPSLAPDGSVSLQQNVSNLLDNPLSHPSIPDDTITISRPSLDSTSPKPSKSDAPLGSLPGYIPNLRNETGCNHTSADPVDDSDSMNEVLTILDSEKETNVNVSLSVNNTDAINHNASDEPVMATVYQPHQTDALDAYERDSLVGQETEINLLSNDVDCVTHNEPDNHRDIETKREEDVSPEHQSTGNQVREFPVEGASHITTDVVCLDLHSDEALVSMSGSEDVTHMSCSQPTSPRMDPPRMDPSRMDPPTTPDQVVTKDVTPGPFNASNFILNCSLKETIFHVSKISEMICRLCLGTGSPEIHRFSADVPLEELSDHCVKEHLQFCEVLWGLRTEELYSLKNKISQIENLETHTILSEQTDPLLKTGS